MPLPRSVSDDALRQSLRSIEDLLNAANRANTELALRVAELEESPGALTDNVPRWIALSVDYTLYTPSTGLTTVDVTITTLPPGTVWTAERIDVDTTFVSAGSIWRMTIKVPTGGASVGGVPKSPDVTTPDPIGQLAADEHVFSDPAGACDVVINLDSGGGDTADQLISGVATVHLLVSIPGESTSTLPAS